MVVAVPLVTTSMSIMNTMNLLSGGSWPLLVVSSESVKSMSGGVDTTVHDIRNFVLGGAF
jgi:type IV secretory pathway VirB2 component (pilin)